MGTWIPWEDGAAPFRHLQRLCCLIAIDGGARGAPERPLGGGRCQLSGCAPMMESSCSLSWLSVPGIAV